jgi:hypothetical protein
MLMTASLIAYAAIFLVVACIFNFIYGMTKRSYYINIPRVPNNSIFGYTRIVFHNRDAHWIYLSLIEKLGPIFQLNFFGSNRVVIADSQLAKIALKGITHKGVGVTSDGINQVTLGFIELLPLLILECLFFVYPPIERSKGTFQCSFIHFTNGKGLAATT